MILVGERLNEAIQEIVEAAKGIQRDEDGRIINNGAGAPSGCTALILVAPDADAICAAKIVQVSKSLPSMCASERQLCL